MILAFTVTLLLLSHACSTSTDASATIFILAGQSNMSGRGGVVDGTWDGVVPPEDRPDPAILRLGPSLNWEPAVEPLHMGIDGNTSLGVGPGLVFANSVKGRAGIGTVRLVPCAIGGTTLREWERGTVLYETMVLRGKAALATVEGGSIGAMLWYQGESDTVNETDATLYGKRLVKFFGHLRKDMKLPLLPIFQVALASGEGPYKDRVREAQLGINLIKVFTVDANGLQLEPDNLHLSTPAQVHLGSMLATAYLNMSYV